MNQLITSELNKITNQITVINLQLQLNKEINDFLNKIISITVQSKFDGTFIFKRKKYFENLAYLIQSFEKNNKYLSKEQNNKILKNIKIVLNLLS